MTRDEALKVLLIMRTADDGCGQCVRELIDQFESAFPEWKELDSTIPYEDY